MRDKHKALKDLAKLGAKYEKRLNALLKKNLDSPHLIDIANAGMQKHVKTLKSLRQFNELAAQQLNLPTKNDIASLARLSIQLEEKIDQIEEQLCSLLEETRADRASVRNSVNNRNTQNVKRRTEALNAAKPTDAGTKINQRVILSNLLSSILLEDMNRRSSRG